MAENSQTGKSPKTRQGSPLSDTNKGPGHSTGASVCEVCIRPACLRILAIFSQWAILLQADRGPLCL